MEAVAQKKFNSRRLAAIQDYEPRLANSHSPHRRRWFDFHPGHLCRPTQGPLLTVSRLTRMGVAVYKISIPDAGGRQPFIRLRRKRRRHKNKREIKKMNAYLDFVRWCAGVIELQV